MKKLSYLLLILFMGCDSVNTTPTTLTIQVPDSMIIEMAKRIEGNSYHSLKETELRSGRLPKKVVLCLTPAFDEDINDRLVFRITEQPNENYLFIDNDTGVIYFFSDNIKKLIDLAPFKVEVCVTDIQGEEACKASKITKSNFERIYRIYGRSR